MGWLPVVIGVAASLLFYNAGHYVLLGIAALCTIGTLWTYGVMHNYAMEAAKRRPGFRGGFWDIEPREADAVPNALAVVSFVFSLASAVLLVTGIVLAL